MNVISLLVYLTSLMDQCNIGGLELPVISSSGLIIARLVKIYREC
jgi:hypothetical protein